MRHTLKRQFAAKTADRDAVSMSVATPSSQPSPITTLCPHVRQDVITRESLDPRQAVVRWASLASQFQIVIVEHALLEVRDGKTAEFQAAFAGAKTIISAMAGFRSLTLSRSFPLVEHFERVETV